MILQVLLGLGWGLAASAAHYLLLRRAIQKRIGKGTSTSFASTHVSSVSRVLVVGGLLVFGVFSRMIRIDVALVVYAVGFLGLLVAFGVKASKEAIQAERWSREPGL